MSGEPDKCTKVKDVSIKLDMHKMKMIGGEGGVGGGWVGREELEEV